MKKQRDIEANISKERSHKWPAVERKFKKLNPICEVCKSNQKLNVHHIKPFHLFPELELEPTNLMTLCMSERECHLKIGHGGNFRAYNPDVVENINLIKSDINLFESVYQSIKLKILTENRK